MFHNGFPFVNDVVVGRVIATIPLENHGNCKGRVTDEEISYFWGQTRISFPYRIYALEVKDAVFSKMDYIEKMILHCIYTRSCDGYVRERHIKALLSGNYPEWAIPYIIKVCDEYVVELLQIVYDSLRGKNTDEFIKFCAENHAAFCKSYSRMISYWNAYYRKWDDYHKHECYDFENYVGRKLFTECFGAEHKNLLRASGSSG